MKLIDLFENNSDDPNTWSDEELIDFFENYDGPTTAFVAGKASQIYRKLKNPSDRVIFAYVNLTPTNIIDVANPSERVALLAIEKSPRLIRFIKEQTPRLQIAAVSKTPGTICGIRKPVALAQWIAVRADPNNIKHIPEEYLDPGIKQTFGAGRV